MTRPLPQPALITRDPVLLAAATRLRHDVFVDEQQVDPAVEADGRDPDAEHAVALGPDGAVVATARMLERADTAVVGRVCVRPGLRAGGYGVAVMRALERQAGERGLPVVELHAQQAVTGFYTRLGYEAFGEPDVEAGIAHRWMRRELLPGLRPGRDDDAGAVQRLIGGCFAEYPGCVLDLPGIDAWMRAPAASYAAKGGGFWVVSDVSACVGMGPGSAPDVVELKSLYVAAAARRQGLARRLVRWVERQARLVGASHVELWSDSRFSDAHRLYRTLGYRQLPGSRQLHDPSHTVELAFASDLVPVPSAVDLEPVRP